MKKIKEMTSIERVLTTLSHSEPDRVPLFLLLTMHGAKEMQMSIKDYFSKGEHVAEGQLRLRAKYGHDCLYSFFYAPVEVEAFGGEVIYREDGPPNSGEPFIRNAKQVLQMHQPDIKGNLCLEKVLDGIRIMKKKSGDSVPVIGVVMSPFSLPVMQMGFDKYLDLMYFEPDLFWHLMKVNQDFIISWANAQLEAGATALAYFDPVSSSTIIPRKKFLETGYKVAKETISKIKGP